jgi:hypothetical protein
MRTADQHREGAAAASAPWNALCLHLGPWNMRVNAAIGMCACMWHRYCVLHIAAPCAADPELDRKQTAAFMQYSKAQVRHYRKRPCMIPCTHACDACAMRAAMHAGAPAAHACH